MPKKQAWMARRTRMATRLLVAAPVPSGAWKKGGDVGLFEVGQAMGLQRQEGTWWCFGGYSDAEFFFSFSCPCAWLRYCIDINTE